MNISGIDNSSSIGSVSLTSGVTSTSAVGQDGDGDGDGRVSGAHRSHRHAFMKSVMDALSAAGLDGSVQPPASSLQTFLHDLFQTLRNNETAQTGSATPTGNVGSVGNAAGAPYSDLTTGLESLLSQFSSGASSTSTDLSQLQSDFQNLVGSLTGTSQASGATLQGFLQNLVQNLEGASASTAAVGSAVDTVA